MSHNINEDRVFTVGKSWHGLGTIVEKEKTAKEAITLAKLDYRVKHTPLYISTNNTNKEVDKVAIIREDNNEVLGITTPKYKIVQNVDAFSFFDVVVGEGQAIYHSAGALGKGERIWILAKLPNDIVMGDDIIEKYLCLTNSHDGKSSLRMYFTPVRVVCQNTLNMSMADASKGIAIRHTGNINYKVQEARRILGLSINYYNQFEQIVKEMENRELQDKELNNYFNIVLEINDKTSTRKENQKLDLLSLVDSGKGQKLGNKHSLWKAYNSVTEYVDHYRTVKNVKNDATNKLSSIWFGSGAKLKEKAYNQALELIK